MAGMIEFNTLRHFKDGNVQYYELILDGRSILEYLCKGSEDKYLLYLPILGSYSNQRSAFNPEEIYTSDWYCVKLLENTKEFAICRRGTTGWL